MPEWDERMSSFSLTRSPGNAKSRAGLGVLRNYGPRPGIAEDAFGTPNSSWLVGVIGVLSRLTESIRESARGGKWVRQLA